MLLLKIPFRAKYHFLFLHRIPYCKFYHIFLYLCLISVFLHKKSCTKKTLFILSVQDVIFFICSVFLPCSAGTLYSMSPMLPARSLTASRWQGSPYQKTYAGSAPQTSGSAPISSRSDSLCSLPGRYIPFLPHRSFPATVSGIIKKSDLLFCPDRSSVSRGHSESAIHSDTLPVQ